MNKLPSEGPPLAIVSAMEEELRAVLALMPDERRSSVAGREFWSGHLHGHQVVAVLSRIGKVAAATTTTVLIERFGVGSVVFTGVAGGLGPAVAVGDLVVAQSFMQHDLDASPIFPKYEVPLYGCSGFATDPHLSARLTRAAHNVAAGAARLIGAQPMQAFGIQSPSVHHGLVITGDRFVSSRAESAQLQMALPLALAVEMEGAAVAQVCHDYGIPFAAVRVISDRADDSAHVNFMSFVADVASRYSAAIVEELLAATDC